MKANRKRNPTGLLGDEEAVSPVIGVILMVAITVVLAAIVFVLVTKLSENPATDSPTVSFSKDTTAGTLTVVQAEPVAWSDLVVTGCTTVPVGGNVTAGQILADCAGAVTVSHAPTNTLIYSTDF